MKSRDTKNTDTQHTPQRPADVNNRADEQPIATFDEGERKPSPIETRDQGGLRAPAPVVSADPKDYVRDADKHTEATVPPDGGQDPKRDTL